MSDSNGRNHGLWRPGSGAVMHAHLAAPLFGTLLLQSSGLCGLFAETEEWEVLCQPLGHTAAADVRKQSDSLLCTICCATGGLLAQGCWKAECKRARDWANMLLGAVGAAPGTGQVWWDGRKSGRKSLLGLHLDAHNMAGWSLLCFTQPWGWSQPVAFFLPHTLPGAVGFCTHHAELLGTVGCSRA